MNNQNPLEDLLYGNTQGKKTFSQFRKERCLEVENDSIKEDLNRSSKKRTGTLDRMEKSYQKRQRDKKIQKLTDNSDHWRRLS